jgi:hypothetical protein
MIYQTVAIPVETLNRKSPEDKGIALNKGLGLSKHKVLKPELNQFGFFFKKAFPDSLLIKPLKVIEEE